MSRATESRSLVDPLADSPISMLRHASSVTLAALSRSLEPLSLRVIDAAALRVISANPGCNQGEVGKLLGVQRTNMVPIVAGLVDSGLVERTVADGRTHALRLTAQGKALHRRALARAEKVEARFFNGLPDDLRASLAQALRLVREAGKP